MGKGLVTVTPDALCHVAVWVGMGYLISACILFIRRVNGIIATVDGYAGYVGCVSLGICAQRSITKKTNSGNTPYTRKTYSSLTH